MKTDEQLFEETISAFITVQSKLEKLVIRYPELSRLCDRLVSVSDAVKVQYHDVLRRRRLDQEGN